MRVFVRLFALLRKHHPGPNRSVPLEVVLPEGARVVDLIPALQLPESLVRAAFVNNAARDLQSELADGDHVGLFPPVVGGGGKLRGAALKELRALRPVFSSTIPRTPP